MASKKEDQDKKVKIRIKPLRGIGGIGDAGKEAWMDRVEAEQYRDDGYVWILDENGEPEPEGEQEPEGDPSTTPEEVPGSAQDEDHAIMKPQSTRRKGTSK